MSILKRTKNIIEAKVQQYEQCFKNPEEEIESALASMNSIIIDLEKSAANSLTEMKIAEKQIEELQGEQAKWLENAKRAVGAGRDDLAHRALLQKKSVSEEIKKCEEFLEKSTENYNYFKTELVLSKEKYQKFSTKLNLLKHNKIMEKTGVKTKGVNEEDEGNLELQFEKLREKAENNISIDEEFENLKKKLKK